MFQILVIIVRASDQSVKKECLSVTSEADLLDQGVKELHAHLSGLAIAIVVVIAIASGCFFLILLPLHQRKERKRGKEVR